MDKIHFPRLNSQPMKRLNIIQLTECKNGTTKNCVLQEKYKKMYLQILLDLNLLEMLGEYRI